ncbi:Ig-like domain-containing protein [Variovorax sp. R-27]|uniref:Ig-like domain-containing protein n=1 Tax=Variovorax sp. R-27 TaxID=3404058 RepID=UPI003CE9744D
MNEILLKEASVVRIGLSKEQIKGMRRVGNDLVITAVSGEVITIREFFASFDGNKNDLVLSDDKDGLWLAGFGEGQGDLVVGYTGIDSIEPLLLHQDFNFGVLPWLVGGGLAVAGAAGGGGGQQLPVLPLAASGDTTPPARPTVNPANASSITGTAEPGVIVKVTDSAGKEIGSATVAPDGSYVVHPTTPPPHGMELRVVAVDRAGNVSPDARTTVDSTPPQMPTVDPTDGSPITGAAEPGSVVTVIDANGTVIGQATAAQNGAYSITPATPPIHGTVINVVAADAVGNVSQPATTTVDSAAPARPTVNPTDGSPVTGTAEAGSMVTIKDSAGKVIGSATAAPNGTYAVTPTTPPPHGTVISVVATDPAGNASLPATATVDSKAPDAPTVNPTAGSPITGTAEAGSLVTIRDDSGTLVGSATVTANGTYSVTPATPPANGTQLHVVATDAAGNVSTEARTAVDSARPAVPTVDPTDGSPITGTAEAGSVVTIKDGLGNLIGSTTAAVNGAYSFTPAKPPADGTVINVVATDAAGNASLPATTKVDSMPPAAPTVSPTNGNPITGTAEAGSVVTIKDGLGNVIGSTTAGPSGTYTIIPAKPPVDGTAINVVATDAAGNASQPATATVDSAPPAAPKVDPTNGSRIAGTAEAGAVVTIKDDSGKVIGSATVAANGTYGITPATPPVDGAVLHVAATDAAGNTSPETRATVDRTPPSAPKVNPTDGDPITGTAEAGSVVTIKDGLGNIVGSATAAANGTYRVTPATVPADGTVLHVVATDAAGNTSPEATTKVDSAAVDMPTINPTSGRLITGAAEAGSLVTIKDGAGNLIGSATAGPNGTYSVTPASTLPDGTVLHVVATDAAGNPSPEATATVDSKPPAAPTINPTNGSAITGTAEANSVVTIKDGAGNVVGTTVALNGKYSIAPAATLPEGTVLRAAAADAAGNTGPEATATVDRTAPVISVAIVNDANNDGFINASEKGADVTVKVTLVSGAAVGDVISLTDGTATPSVTLTAADVANGFVNVSFANPAEGRAIRVSATSRDLAGNVSTSAVADSAVLDTTPPAAVIAAVTDNAGPVRGALANGSTTDDTMPAFDGSGATPGDVIKVFDNGSVIGSTTVDAGGSWSVRPGTPLGEGAHRITQTATDAAGNTSVAGAPLDFKVDTTSVPVNLKLASGRQSKTFPDGFTDETSPTLEGKTTAGAVVTVTEGANVLGSTTADASGNWRLALPVQREGAHQYTATAVNAAGTNSKATLALTIDATPPAVPSIAEVMDDAGSVLGPLANGGFTDDTTPTFAGSGATPGDKIRVYDNGIAIGTTTVKDDGSWSFAFTMANTPLKEGVHRFTATALDPVGNESVHSGSFSITVDRTPPVAPPNAASYADDAGAVKNPASVAATTDDATPGINIGAVAAGLTPSLYVDGTKVAAAYDPATGTLTPSSPLAEGEHQLSYTLTDQAGNESPRSGAFRVGVDTTPPPALDPSRIEVLDNVGAVKGPLAAGAQTDDSKPEYTGKADPAQASSINVYDNGKLIGSTAVNADGSWRFTPDLPLAEGAHSLTAQGVDAAGNVSAITPASTFTLLGDRPTPPAITGVSDDRGSVSGNIAKDASTDDTTPTLSGTGTVGTVVTVYADGVAVGSASVAANGTWSVTTSPLSGDGVKNLSAVAVDGAGQASLATGLYPIVLDTTAPATPAIVVAADDQGAVTGPITAGGITDDASPTFGGNGVKAGDTVKVYDGATLIGSTTAATDGAWSVTPSKPLGEGAHSITHTVTDAAGNTSVASAPLDFKVDTTDVVVSIAHAADDQGSVRGNLAPGARTDDTTPTLEGKATAGAIVTVKEGTTVLGSTTTDASGNWRLALPVQGEGAHNYTATAVNAAGKNGEASFALTIDTSAPNVPAVAGVADDVGSVQGPLANGAASDDTTPTLTGSGATPGDVIRVYDNGSPIGSTAVKADGSWSFTPTTPLTEGAHRLTATSIDPVGNESRPSGDFVINVDTTAPAAPAAATSYADDSGAVKNPASAEKTTDDTTPSINIGTLAAGLTPSLYIDGTKVAATYDPLTGTLTPANPLGEGTHQLSYTLTDPAGNESRQSPALAVAVDTTAPATPAAATGYADDAGPVRNSASVAATTDDTTPGINIGTVAAGLTPSLYVDGSKVAATYDPLTGTLTPTSPLAEGAHQIGYTLTDAAGNESKPSPALAVTVDTTAPAAPAAATGYADNFGAVQSPASTAATTDDTTPGINVGTVAPGSTPSLYVDGAKVAATYDPATGTLTPTDPLGEGAHQISYTLTDAAGNESKQSPALAVTVDTAPPAALDPSLIQVLDDVGAVTGPIAAGAQTDDSKPTYAGKADPTQVASVNVYDNGKLIGSTAVNADGSWRFTPALPLATGAHSLTAQAVDAAGNVSAVTPASTFTLLGDAPAAPAITGVSDDKGSVSGSIGPNASTDDNTPTISGTGTVGTIVTVYADGVAVGSTSVAANGTWSVTTSPLSGDGVKNLKAIAVDGAGQASPATGDYPIVLDTTAPLTPAVVVVTDDQGAVIGAITTGGTTDDASPAFSGSGANVGDIVKVYDGATLIGSTTVKAGGSWSLTPEKPLGQGAHSITHTLTDAAGNTSAASAPLAFTVDTSGVVVSVGHAVDDHGSIRGNLAPGALTDDTTPTLVGTATAGAIVTVKEGTTVLGSTTADASGNWRLTLPEQGEGAHNYTATAVNAAGTKGEATLSLTIDMTAPSVPAIGKAGDDVGSVQGPLASGSATDDTTPTLAGIGATPGDVIKVYDNGSPIGSTAVKADGSWSFTPTTPLAEGAHRLTTTAVDPVGNESKPSGDYVVNVDTTAPATPAAATGYADNIGAVQNPASTASTTDDATPGINIGAVPAGLTPSLYVDGTKVAATYDPVAGTLTPNTPLTEGAHQLGYTLTDAAGNESKQAPTLAVAVNTSAPATPATAAGYADNVGAIQNPASTASTTDDTTPGINIGTVAAGLTPSLYVDGTKVAATYDPAAGTLTPTNPLGEGAHQIGYTLTDAAGNEGKPSPALAITVDTTAPAAPAAATSYVDDAGAIRNPASVAATSDDTTPGINIGTVAAGSTPSLYVDGTKVAATYDPATGTLTPTNPLGEGTHQLSYTLTDPAGNESPRSGAFTLNVDTTAPAALDPSLIQVLDDVGAVTGPIATGAQTDDSKPVYTGKADAAQVSSINVYDNGKLIGSTAVNADGSWRFEPALPLATGPHSLTAQAVDAAGNVSSVTPASTFTLLGDAPAAPAITGVNDDKGGVSGSVAPNASTDDNTLTLNGTGTAGTIVIVRADGVPVGSASVAVNGTWSMTTSPLSGDGVKNLSAVAVDGAGQTSPATGAYPIVLDTTAPATPGVVGATDDQGAVTGPIVAGGTTDDASPTFGGSGAQAGDTARVYDGATLLGSATVKADGSWSFTPSTPLGQGAHSITHTLTDTAGNTSVASAPLDFKVDTTDVVVSIAQALDDKGSKQGNLAAGASTDDTTPTLAGSATAGAVVTVKEGAAVLGSTTADANGNWSLALPVQGEGAHNYTATAVNAAGKNGAASLALTIDTSAPNVPAIGGASDDVGSVQGPLASGGASDDTTPTLTGSGATPGDVIQVYDNGGAIGSTTVKADGSWSFTPTTPLAEGAHRLTATAIDPVGNESKPSGDFVINVDTTAPAIKATLGAISTDTGTSSSDFVTSDRTLVATVTIDAAMEAGATVQVSLDNGKTWNNATLVSGSTYQYDNTGVSLPDGSHTFLARVVDAAGNATQATSQVVVIDSSAPTTDNAVAITAYTDDVAPNTGEYGSGTSTNDTTPVLKGTVSGLKAGDVVQIYEGTALLGTATVTGATWIFATPALANGSTHNYTAVIADAAGNKGTASADFTLTVHTGLPLQSVAITGYTDNEDPQQGTFASGSTTNDTSPQLGGTLAGTLVVGEVVAVYRDGVRLGVATMTSAATWTFQDAGLVDGTSYSYTARVEDGAGNRGGASAAFRLTVDQSAPTAAPSIDGAMDDVAPVTGPITSGSTTNDTRPELKGAGAEPNGTVRVYDNGTLIGTAMADGSGKWSFTPEAGKELANGAHSLTTSNVDAAGNEGPKSTPLTFTVDTIAPTQSTVVTAVNDDLDPQRGMVANNGHTNDLTPQVAGTISVALNAGETVVVLRDGAVVGTATMTDATNWTFNDAGLSNGQTYSYTARVEDAGGNRGAISGSYAINIDTSVPKQVVTISTVFDNVDPGQGNIANGGTTNDSQPELRGTLSIGLGGTEVVVVYRDGARIGNASVFGTSWSFIDATGLVNASSYSYTARVENAAGNAGAASSPYAITLQTTGSATTATITAVIDDVDPQQGTVANNGDTNDTAPQITGSITAALQAGEKVVVLRDGKEVGTATMTDATHWTYADSGLASGGTYVYTARIQDAAANPGADSNAYTIRIDTTAPTQRVVLTRAIDNVDPVSGDIAANGSTNDDTPTLEGTLSAALNGTEQLHVFRNGAHVGTAKVTGTAWTFEDASLSSGTTYTYEARVMDAAGNAGAASNSLSFTVNTSGVTQTVQILQVQDDTDPVQGNVANGGATNDTTPTFSGSISTALNAGDVVQVLRDGTVVGTATVTNTSWSFSDAGLADGTTYSYTARVVNSGGNQGAPSAAYAITLDRTAPTQTVAITSYTDDQDPQQGTFTSGSTTNDATPQLNGTFAGTLGAGEVVVYRDGVRLGAATVTGAATWTFQDAGLANGTSHSYTARVEDAAGNRGATSAAFTLTVDQSMPTAAPSIDSVMDNTAPVIGPITSGSTTNETRPALQGSGAEPNGTVRVYDNGALIGSATADGAGKWSFTPEAGKELANGAHSLTTSNVDAAGNEGPKSTPLTFAVDTIAPSAAPSIDSVMDNTAPVTGPITSGSTTNETRPVLQGAGAEPNGTVRIYDNGTLIGSATADGAGKWSFTPAVGSELANGMHSLTTSNVDAAGNEGPRSAPLAFTVDTVAPSTAPSVDSVMDNIDPVSGPITSGSTTNETHPALKGAGAEPNGIVRVYDNGTLIGSATADGRGNWSFTPEPGKELANGAHSLTTSNVDAAGNEGPKSTPLTFTVDTVAPPIATLSLGNYSDSFPAAGTLAANQSSDHNSNDNTFDLVLTGADASTASYEVSTDGGLVWKATTAAQNNLSDGKYLFRATLTDAAGNSTAAANNIAVTVDRTSPGLDLQRVGSTLVAGTTEAYALVAIDVGNNGSVEASVTADTNGNWTWTSSTPIAANTVVSAVAYDLAGNASSKGTQAADTTPPAVTIQKSDGNSFSGTTSDADMPVVSPTATRPITVRLSVDSNADGVVDYVLPFTATVTADGTWGIDAKSAPVNVGAIVTAVAQDYNGNLSAPATVTVGGGTSKISGSASHDNFGYDVQAIGDFNGDGYNDFAVVAPHGSSAQRSANKWSVNILYGSKQGLPDLSDIAHLPGTDGLKIYTSGDISDSNILTAVQGYGDVNGDGYSDVIVYDDNLNSDWVIFGRSSASATSTPVNVDVRTIISSGGDSDGVAIVQREGGSTWFGAGGALVDVNGDGYADIVMQDWQRGTGSSGTAIIYGHAGAAGTAAWANYYVGFTGSSPSSYVSDSRGSSTESSRPHTVIYNDNTNGYPVNVVNIGDINGDGYSDFAYSLYNARNPVANLGDAGAIQVIYGTAKGFPQDYSLQTDYTNIANGFRVYGEQASQFLGTYIDPEPYGYLSNTGMPTSSGDVNGDGIEDLIIGSPQFGPDAGEQSGPGRVYVVYGKAGGVKSNINLANLSSADGFVITASDSTPDAMFGNGTSVGDFNGDGIDDIAIGAPLADIGGINNGAVYIVYGQQGGYSGTMSVAATYSGAKLANSASFTYRQNGDANSGSMLGVNVALSDLNGDGQADLALGSAYQGMPWTPAAGYLEVVYADAFNFTNLMTVGDDVIKATAGRDRLSGGAGNDVITGVQAGDSAYGGAGNDSIHINEINGVVRVDGGLWIDTLAIDSSNVTLDLSQLGLKVKGFENFDLGRGAGNTGNVLKLRIADVLSQQSSTGTGNGAGQGHLRVTGDASDTVELLRGTDSWSNTGTTNVGGVSYSIYHNSTLPAENTLGDIWIQQGVTVVVNSGGNQQAPTQTVAITSYTDDQGSSKGSFGSGTTTDDANPVLNGTLAGSLGASEVVAVYRDGTRLGNATMTGGATWTFEDAGLADGKTYSYTARVEDAVSNRGGAWATFTITVDYAVTVNSQVTVDTTPLVTGTMPFKLTNGEFIEVTIDGKTYSSANGAVVVDSQHNTWYVQVPSAIALGTYDVKAVVKSASGVLIASDDTKGELIVSAAPTVTVGSAASDPNQKATAYTLGENGMWRIHTNQTMLDASGTDSASLGNFNQTHLWSNTNEAGSLGYDSGYAGRNYVQNATFMDFNRDGHMDLFAEDSTYDDGQQAFIFNGSGYTAVQVGGPSAVGGDKLTLGSANTFSWYGGVMAFDKTGDGFIDLAYGDQTPNDSTSGGGYDSQVVLNVDGSILGMTKDSGYTDDQAATPGPANSSNYQNATFDMELSGVDLNNDGKVDIVYHATAGLTKIGGPSADPALASTAKSSDPYRLVVATNKGDGTWENTQIIEQTFQRADDDPSYGNGISMTWADFNGDGYMDLFMGRGYSPAVGSQYQSRLLFNDGTGKLAMDDWNGDKIGKTPTNMFTFADWGGSGTPPWQQGGPSLAVDWNGDGKMDAIELPGFGATGGLTAIGNTGQINLYTNNSSAGKIEFGRVNLLGGSSTIGNWTGDPLTNNAVTGAIAADIDWDGDRDLLAFTQKGNTKFIANTSTVADGTSLHFRIFDAQGINALYGNTVQLFDSSGKRVATQMINPQSGNQTNDSSAIVDFYGLDPKETYTLALLRIVNGAAADVGGMGNLGGNTIENVNAAWTGLKAGEANHAFVLTTESGSNVADANIGNGIVGTGYNDTFFATRGNDKFEGGGGAVTVSGVRAWSNTGGIDIVDYKLADSASLTIDLGNTGAQNTGFGTATFKNIEGLAGGSGADTFTDNAGDNVFEGRAGNDTFKLTGGGKDTLLYKLLATTDATGGNGADAVSSFEVGTFEATANADRIELKDLLVGYTADADGAARYINGVATIDSGDAIGNYLSVTVSGGNTTLNIDRDGSGSAYSATALITLNGVTTDLATLLANHQLVLA